MKTQRHFWIALALAAGICYADVPPSAYQARTYSDGKGNTLLYRLFVPKNYTPTRSYPLVLALHGQGESGTNNTAQITANHLCQIWAEDTTQAKYPNFVVAPQKPTSTNTWLDVNQPMLDSILASLEREFSIDANRLYLTGLSQGGGGDYAMMIRHPTRFAACVPMSMGGDNSKVSIYKDMPIWGFVGDQDFTLAGMVSLFDALKKAGSTAKLTTLVGYDHNSPLWNKAVATPELLPWVFSKTRSGSISISIPARSGNNGGGSLRLRVGQGAGLSRGFGIKWVTFPGEIPVREIDLNGRVAWPVTPPSLENRP